MPDKSGRRLMWVVWPAFLVAGVAEALFFTVFDPIDLHFFGAPLEISREAIYTLGFFGFWAPGHCLVGAYGVSRGIFPWRYLKRLASVGCRLRHAAASSYPMREK